MSERERKLNEIKEALDAATPGPWFAVRVDSDSYSISNKPGYYGHSITGWGRVLQTKEDAHLIANAPEWLQWAVQEIERLQDELDRQHKQYELLLDDASDWTDKAMDKAEQLREENRKLREERDAYYNNAKYTEAAFHGMTSLRSQLQSAQQEIERLREEREKLIEGLRWYADSRNWAGDVFAPPEGIPPEVDDGGQRARNILKEIGVTLND